MYACIAARVGNEKARCLNPASEGGNMCPLHGAASEREVVALAPSPDMVLYKFDINGAWRQKFVDAGVEVKPLDTRTREIKRATDTGTQVFGPDGLKMVSLTSLVEELAKTYKVVDIWIQPRTGASDALVVSFSNVVGPSKNTKAMYVLMDLLSVRCWKYVHVWANPPRQEDKLIVHTVNSIHWAERKPIVSLHFENGLWAAPSC